MYFSSQKSLEMLPKSTIQGQITTTCLKQSKSNQDLSVSTVCINECTWIITGKCSTPLTIKSQA